MGTAEAYRLRSPPPTYLVHIFLVCSEMTPHCCRDKEEVSGGRERAARPARPGRDPPPPPGPAAHRRQERSDLVGPQRLVTDAAVVVVLKSEAERVQHASASTFGLARSEFFHLVGFGADAAPEFT